MCNSYANRQSRQFQTEFHHFPCGEFDVITAHTHRTRPKKWPRICVFWKMERILWIYATAALVRTKQQTKLWSPFRMRVLLSRAIWTLCDLWGALVISRLKLNHHRLILMSPSRYAFLRIAHRLAFQMDATFRLHLLNYCKFDTALACVREHWTRKYCFNFVETDNKHNKVRYIRTAERTIEWARETSHSTARVYHFCCVCAVRRVCGRKVSPHKVRTIKFYSIGCIDEICWPQKVVGLKSSLSWANLPRMECPVWYHR